MSGADLYPCDVCGQMVPAGMLSAGEVCECDDCLASRIREARNEYHREKEDAASGLRAMLGDALRLQADALRDHRKNHT